MALPVSLCRLLQCLIVDRQIDDQLLHVDNLPLKARQALCLHDLQTSTLFVPPEVGRLVDIDLQNLSASLINSEPISNWLQTRQQGHCVSATFCIVILLRSQHSEHH